MYKLILGFLLTVALGCQAQPAAPAAAAGNGFSMDAKPVTFKNLQLYAIRASQQYLDEHQKFGHYKTLKEGIDAGSVKVTEKSAAPAVSNSDAPPQDNIRALSEEVELSGDPATVNTLQVENTSNDTVFLMAGELVKGGKQDRVIAQDMLLPPKSGKRDLPVFCVEHGRWTYDNAEKAGEKAMFSSYQNVTSGTVRKTVATEQAQSAVWRDVAVVTTANNADESAGNVSGTYNGLEKNEAFVKQREEYLAAFKASFDSSANVIGVVAMSGNKVIGSDIFYSNELFRKQYQNLLYSYITDAISSPGKKENEEKAVNDFFTRVQKEYHETDGTKNKSQLKNGGKVMHKSAF